MNRFPLSACFILPDGTSYCTNGKSHEETARNILRSFGVNLLDVYDAEGELQKKYSALLVRYRWGKKLVYLPQKAPPTCNGCKLVCQAIEFYRKHDYEIVNVFHINFEELLQLNEKLGKFIVEEYNIPYIWTFPKDYTHTIIWDSSKKKYVYNPCRLGD